MKKFGTFKGVFVPSFEAILGTVLFLLMPGLVGGMGIWLMVVIVALANTVTLATSFSIADCTTNLERVGAGGMYAISRRSLGRAFGGSIGIQLYLAQAASIGFYVIGFSLPLQPLIGKLPFFGELISQYSPETQRQIIATAIAILAFGSAIIGADFITKIQFLIFIVLIVSVGSIFLSPLFGLSEEIPSIFTANANWQGVSDYAFVIGGFWAAFAIFFPAVTGIDAGVGMSGNLKDPRRSLGKGTFIAIGITFLVYLGMVFVFGFIKSSLLEVSETVQGNVYPSVVDIYAGLPAISFLLLLGILFATGSSALSYFMTAPRTAQALARDRILPRFLDFLGRDLSRKGKEPRWATVFTFVIVIAVVWLTAIDTASIVVGICFLVVYGWVNLAAFFERISGNPSFRPTSKGHWAISLYGFLLCMVVICLFSIWVGICVIASQLIIFLLLLKFKTQNRLEGVWWGLLFNVLNWGFKRMRLIIRGSKNWRPIVGIFCFADREEAAQTTLKIGRRIANYRGLNTINILKPLKIDKTEYPPPEGAQIIESTADDYNQSVLAILQGAMPGGFQINTALLPLDSRLNYIELTEKIIDMRKEVLLYKHSKLLEAPSNRIDIWWKGEENGNFMALLAYIINRSDISDGKPEKKIRLLRKLSSGEEKEQANNEMEALLYSARINGEVLILEEDENPIHHSIHEYSKDAELILMGFPGTRSTGISRLFALDKLFFTRELEKYDDLPPMLFVKAHMTIELFEG